MTDMNQQDGNLQGAAQSFLSTRKTLKTATQEAWSRYVPSDEVMQIRQTVQVETLGQTERQVREWSTVLRNLIQYDGDPAEVNAIKEILARSVLPVTAVVALRNHWRFSSPTAAFNAFWTESLQAVTRFNPASGRLRFAAFMENTLSRRAEAVAEDAEGGERKLLERIDSLKAWIEEFGLTPSVTADELFHRIQTFLTEAEFEHQYFTTVRRVENALEALRVRGSGNLLSIDFTGNDEDETGSLADTLMVDDEVAERSRLRSEVGSVLTELEAAGLLDEVMALPEGMLNELLESAAKAKDDAWLTPMAMVFGLSATFVKEVVRIALPFFKNAA
ncbi:hypothetical protein [Deinococcus multiflagellatus]|uniref:Uncharacterized protein n=1 Tax=Deinococcus multiflagellatus TaxID=1656887 RepID=A0ABW1ZQ97_9DEIO|nr:hypothetical protein [Deinococcus multiflagellatus]MBZ9714959.1 hypothetical protein [Deinococcus multiflagellatus]